MKLLFTWMTACLRAWAIPRRFDLAVENLALRQQVVTLQRGQIRPKLRRKDRCFWVMLSRLWRPWRSACLVVSPSTVVAWHRAGFQAFWRWRSRRRGGRPGTHRDLAATLRRMASENPLWGAPRIHGELRMLGYRVSLATVSRLLPNRRPSEGQRQSWRAFLHNHREHLAGMDFFTVPTATFRSLYGLVIIRHGRRAVAHLGVTAHPTAAWLSQQLREAFPEDTAPRYLVFDRDRIFGATKDLIHRMGIEPKVIGFRCPWQNGAVERFIGTLRRELLDHVIVWDEAHLTRLLREFTRYYHEDRTHIGLGGDTPSRRPRDAPPAGGEHLCAEPRLGGLHHRYTWRRAA